jgi:hypothetical protein
MPWYRCKIRGENFPGELAETIGLVGFYTTRFVEVRDESEAETEAVEGLRADPKLVPPPGYVSQGIARVFVDEIALLSEDSVPANQAGLVWYPMEAD